MSGKLSKRRRSISSLRGAAALLVVAVFGVALGCSTASVQGPTPAQTSTTQASTGQATPSAARVLVTGRAISPAGTSVGPVGGMPLNVVISPDGKYAVTTSSSLDTRLCSIRVSDGAMVSSVPYPTFVPNDPNSGLFYGLVFGPGNTLYAAQGTHGTVAVLTLGADGSLTRTHTIPSVTASAYEPVDQPAGLALDGRGFLYMTNYIPVNLQMPVPPASTLSIYSTLGARPRIGTFTFPGTTPCYPRALVCKTDGSTAYVASERDSCVYVLDTLDPTHPTLAATIGSGATPSALLLDRAQTRLFVANAGSDTISIVDTGSNKVVSTVVLRPPNVSTLPGVSPSGLALSPDESTLYASLGDFNAVAVIDVARGQLRGYIPVGWYPTAVAVSPDGRTLLVTNGWGSQAMNPNTVFNFEAPDVLAVNFTSAPPSYANSPGPGYVENGIPGSVSRIDLTQAMPALAESTLRVVENTQNTPATGSATNSVLASLGVGAGKIKHVIYVIKENRGYDQVLGDLPKGNGDPSLTLFGREVTPNQHALAERFILLDNYYNNAPVSGEGWTWCTQSVANAFVIRAIPYIYRLALPTYEINYDFEGQNTSYITGGYPAKDPDGRVLSSGGDVPPIPNVAEAPGGYIWDKVKAAGITYRNYGFFLSTGVPANPPFVIPDNYPNVAGLQPPGHIPPAFAGQPRGASDYDFRRFDFGYADSDAWVQHGFTAKQVGLTTGGGTYSNTPTHPAMPSRFSEWNREFQEMLKEDPSGATVPTFTMLRFMRDHTMGLNPGFGSPKAMMADNDYAVGQLVDVVSKSPIWKSTAIFVIEDDAQFSPDHVDAHRSFCLVISPWIRKGTVDSSFYNTISVLKSMELLLGLTPMSQYDAFARPISGGWDTAPNNDASYDAVLPPRDIIGAVNPSAIGYAPKDPRRRMAALCSRMNFNVADAAPVQQLNEIIWKSVKGADSEMPAPRLNELPGLGSTRKDDDD